MSKEVKEPNTIEKLRKMVVNVHPGEIWTFNHEAVVDAIRIMEAMTKRTNTLNARLEKAEATIKELRGE